MEICLLIFICIYFHRYIVLLLSSPVIAIEKRAFSGPISRVISFFYRRTFAKTEDLFLRWIGEIHSHRIRKFFYIFIFNMNIGENCVIYDNCEIRKPSSITIGKGSIIGNNAILDGRAGITICKNVCLASNVSIWTFQHDYRDPLFRCTKEHYGPVRIEDRAWIGPNTIILHDVIIGEGAVVAAGSVVTKNVPPYSVVAGIPAKVIGQRPKDICYEFDGSYRHFI